MAISRTIPSIRAKTSPILPDTTIVSPGCNTGRSLLLPVLIYCSTSTLITSWLLRIIRTSLKRALVNGPPADDIKSTRVEDVEKATNYVSAALDAALAGKPIEIQRSKAYGCSVKYWRNKAAAYEVLLFDHRLDFHILSLACDLLKPGSPKWGLLVFLLLKFHESVHGCMWCVKILRNNKWFC